MLYNINKSLIVTLIAAVCSIIFIYAVYDKFSVKTVSYSGLGDSTNVSIPTLKKEIIVTDEIRNSEKIEFAQRKLTGGGVNPGWVISLLETQPNIFTGRVIVDDGVYQHPVFLREDVPNIFIGDMKGLNGKKEIFSMRKTDKDCTDVDGNVFEYSLSGTYGSTNFSGCGGDILKAVE